MLATFACIFIFFIRCVSGLKLRQKQIWAWVDESHVADASKQLEEHPGLFDGVFLWGGLKVNNTNPLRPSFYLAESYSSTECVDFRSKLNVLGIELHMAISRKASSQLMPVGLELDLDMSGIVESSIALATEHGWGGLNFDDESEGCPRKNPTAFRHWVKNIGEWADALQESGVRLTVDVQGMTCSVCSPWPACLPANRDALSSGFQANLTGVRDLLSSVPVHRWIEMDTYYGNIDFFMENIDWYTNWLIPMSKVGLGVCPNSDCNPINESQTQARFDALERTAISTIDLWRLPLHGAAANVWFPRLRAWKG